MRKILYYKAYVYLLAWCIYNAQGIIFPRGSAFTQLLVLVLLLTSLYYIFVANTRYKLPVYFVGLNILLGLFTVYGVYLMIGGYDPLDYAKPVDSFNYLKKILISLTPVYAFYVFSKEGLITERGIRNCFFILFGLTIANYYQKYQEMLYWAMLIGSNAEEFTNNVAYDFLSLIPFGVFFYRKVLMQYIVLGCCMLFLFMAMKRGAVLIGFLCFFLFIWKTMSEASLKKKMVVLFLSVILSVMGGLFVERQMQESSYFHKRVEDTLNGNSSNRDKLYVHFANYVWNETTPLQFVFGSGANATLKVFFNYAHNDWLEIAVNQGVLGILFFIVYWVLFAKTAMSRSFGPHEKLAMQIIWVAFFMRTFFSMSYGSMGYIPMMILGFCLSQEKKNEQIVNCN